jgi:hypothetical protein
MGSIIKKMEGGTSLIITAENEGFLVQGILLQVKDAVGLLNNLSSEKEPLVEKVSPPKPEPIEDLEYEDIEDEDIEDEDIEDEDIEDEDTDDIEDEDTDDIEDTGEDEDFYTAEEIMAMKRDQLVEIIELNDLDVDPEDYPKTSKLREAIVSELGL